MYGPGVSSWEPDPCVGPDENESPTQCPEPENTYEPEPRPSDDGEPKPEEGGDPADEETAGPPVAAQADPTTGSAAPEPEKSGGSPVGGIVLGVGALLVLVGGGVLVARNRGLI